MYCGCFEIEKPTEDWRLHRCIVVYFCVCMYTYIHTYIYEKNPAFQRRKIHFRTYWEINKLSEVDWNTTL